MRDGGVDGPLKGDRETRHEQIFSKLPPFIGPLIRKGPPFVEEKMNCRCNGISGKKAELLSPPIRKQLAQSGEDKRYRPSHEDVARYFHDKLSVEHSA